MELNRSYQLLVCGREHLYPKEKHRSSGRDVGSGVNTAETKYMVDLLPECKDSSNLIYNKVFENVAIFKYLLRTVTNQNFIHKEI
jgi:hypothetical protein